MISIDAHQHFWKYHPVEHEWINESMAVIRRDFMPTDSQSILAENNIHGCIAVQADQSIKETNFLIDLAAEHSFIKGVVGWVDLNAATIQQQLEQLQQYPILKGFRHILQAEHPSFMLQQSFLNGIAALQQYNFTYDILIAPTQLASAIQLVQQYPNQLFVIDHLAKPYIKAGLIDEWKKDIQTIAQYSNVYCKISGMVTEANYTSWKYADFVPYLDVVVEAFGIKRIMYGSDWPVCLLAASYKNALAIVQQYFATFSENEQQAFFANNATQFYHL